MRAIVMQQSLFKTQQFPRIKLLKWKNLLTKTFF